MATTKLISFDPGLATGVFYGSYTDQSPLTRTASRTIDDGPYGLSKFLVEFLQENRVDIVVSELFRPDGSAGARETVSPQGEGVIIAHFPHTPIVWQPRSDKTWGLKGTAYSDQKLKDLGLWVTGEQVSWEDGRDANDAALHAYAYMRRIKHKPTLRLLSA